MPRETAHPPMAPQGVERPPWLVGDRDGSAADRSPEAGPETLTFLQAVVEKARFAFQPIVNVHTGACYGFEALLRGTEAMEAHSIAQVFDRAEALGCLHRLDLILRERALEGFLALDRPPESKLFFNLDPRTAASPDFRPHRTAEILARHGLPADSFCLELSSRHAPIDEAEAARLIRLYRAEAYRLALDDFGAAFSGLRLLHDHQPDFVKIDRFFVTGIHRDARKKMFVAAMTGLAHVLGITVIALGVESEADFLACRQIGCDLVQGHFVARPTEALHELRPRYPKVAAASRRDRRGDGSDRDRIMAEIQFLPPLRVDDGLQDLFEAFARNKDLSFFPVIERSGEPLGLVRESDLKGYAYSPFGRDLISNKSYGRSIRDFVRKCPTADIQTEAEKILEIFSLADEPEGIVITAEFSYVGFLSAASLLRIINAKNLAQAQDQNPLTRLPGNASITEYITRAVEETNTEWVLVYFDFNAFKPFNDTYGFRQGDRAILLFAELMRKHLEGNDAHLGHVGGDDFFAGFRNVTPTEANARVRKLLEAFREDVESFYDPEAKEKGCICARDRDGTQRCFPLLSCSAAALHLPRGIRKGTLDDVITLFATMKKNAKACPDGFCAAGLI